LYTMMILYTMRAVTSAFTPNDMKKNAITIERYQTGTGSWSAVSWIWIPGGRQCGDYDAKVSSESQLIFVRLAPKNASDKMHGITMTNSWRHMIQHR
jgi:hypothetical protein